jgi:putative oxidoreductase
MTAFLNPYEGRIYALLRIVAGFLFTCHGLQKIFGLFGGPPAEAPAFVIFAAGGIELVGGALIAVGFMTRWAAFLCSGLMAAAYFMAHHDFSNLFPITNRGELAVLYSFVFLYIAVKGSGTWSIDRG